MGLPVFARAAPMIHFMAIIWRRASLSGDGTW